MKSHKIRVDNMLKDADIREIYTHLNISTRSWFEHKLLPMSDCSEEVKNSIMEELSVKYLDVFTPLIMLQEQLNYAREWAAQRETVVYENKRIKKTDFLAHIQNLKKRGAVQLEHTAKSKFFSLNYIKNILKEKNMTIEDFCSKEEYLFLEVRMYLKSKEEARKNSMELTKTLSTFSNISMVVYQVKESQKNKHVEEMNQVIENLMERYYEIAFSEASITH